METVWVKGKLDETEVEKVVVLLDKNDNPIYYTTVSADLVQVKEEE